MNKILLLWLITIAFGCGVMLVAIAQSAGLQAISIDFSSRDSVRNFAFVIGKAEEEYVGTQRAERTDLNCKFAHARETNTRPDEVDAGLAGFFIFGNGRRYYLCYGPAIPRYEIICGLVDMVVSEVNGSKFTCRKGVTA